MDQKELRRFTRDFAAGILRFAETLPRSRSGRVIADQLIRSGSSVGANYRAACRAKSRADMAAKLGIVLEEADESQYWLELSVEVGIVSKEIIAPHHQKANEIVAMMVASIQTLRRQQPNRGISNRGIEESA